MNPRTVTALALAAVLSGCTGNPAAEEPTAVATATQATESTESVSETPTEPSEPTEPAEPTGEPLSVEDLPQHAQDAIEALGRETSRDGLMDTYRENLCLEQTSTIEELELCLEHGLVPAD